jgi:hypothetical protein
VLTGNVSVSSRSLVLLAGAGQVIVANGSLALPANGLVVVLVLSPSLQLDNATTTLEVTLFTADSGVLGGNVSLVLDTSQVPLEPCTVVVPQQRRTSSSLSVLLSVEADTQSAECRSRKHSQSMTRA